MISFIVPIYNAETYFPSCIESLLHQTEQDLQIILVDDQSTDGSFAIAQSFATQDPRILLLQQPHAGQSAARNLGLQHAKGEFIAFVDADDTIEPDWSGRHLEAIDGVDYVQSGYKRIYNGDTTHTRPRTPLHPYIYTSPCMRLYRAKAIEGMRFTEGVIYEDVRWSVYIWTNGLKCRMINYAGYHYTANPHSTTSQRHPEAHKRVIQDLYKMLKGASLRGKLIICYTIIRMKIHYIRS